MSEKPTLSSRLRQWAAQLETCSDSARLDAEILLRHVSGLSATQLIVNDNRLLESTLVNRVDSLVKKRLQGQPIAYLTGEREFYSLSLKVDQTVLIPRPETELLVEQALAFIHSRPSPTILDLGTGSGAVALALGYNAPNAELVATDIETASLELAHKNAVTHGIRNVEFLQSDWYYNLAGRRFDLIVSNPPYIEPGNAHLRQGDVRFEPQRALIALNNGLADITHIIEFAPAYLKPEGVLALEHGYNQGKAVRELLQKHGFKFIRTLKDLNNLDRVTKACLA